MSFIVDAVKDVIDWVAGAIEDVVDFVFDEIVEPVVSFVGDTVQALLDDPIQTIAKVVAIATGNAWAIPLIDGASTAANGGDLGDVLKSVAVSYVARARLAQKLLNTPLHLLMSLLAKLIERRRKRVSRFRDYARYCCCYASHYCTGKTPLKPLLEVALPLRYPQV